MKFATCDQHFHHANIILPTYCFRPFRNVEEMNEEYVDRWNYFIKDPPDIVYALGDIVWNGVIGREQMNILKRLRGYKILFRGNHDHKKPRTKQRAYEALFDEVHNSGEVIFDTFRAYCNHYSCDSIPKTSLVHLFGHSHGSKNELELNRFDVGVDVWDGFPVPEPVLREIITMKANGYHARNKAEAIRRNIPVLRDWMLKNGMRKKVLEVNWSA